MIGNPGGVGPMGRLGAAAPTPRPRRVKGTWERAAEEPPKEQQMGKDIITSYRETTRHLIQDVTDATSIVVAETRAGAASEEALSGLDAAIVALAARPAPALYHRGHADIVAQARRILSQAGGIRDLIGRFGDNAAVDSARRGFEGLLRARGLAEAKGTWTELDRADKHAAKVAG